MKKKPSSTTNIYKLVIEFTMQKIVNIIAIASGVVSLTVIGVGGYVFIRKDAIIESIKEKALGSIGGGALGGAIKMLPMDDPSDMAPPSNTLPLPSPSPPTPSAPIGF